MDKSSIIILAGSAGSYGILVDIIKALPSDMTIPIVVVLHRNAKYETHIEQNLSSKCEITVKAAEEKEDIMPGVVYFAPPGYHLLIEPNYTFSLDLSEPVQFCRPSIDVTMESAADVYLTGTIGILFSGANQDGADGMAYIKQMGGTCIVQDPQTAEIPTMPEAAIRQAAYDQVLDSARILDYILTLNKPHIKN
ncbi:chemotaxis protein CheB [Sphingobacterium sp. SYP-B4668]|uniref:chemotaxis protein CheB n=1 Tax=Sphingobacterium sp. SYP-B4668 TaxID=2996035 RepID=UPI0022DE66FA|nr:chemotaxis protein CheB [Sphingobacterium sp. SYP-B4668]